MLVAFEPKKPKNKTSTTSTTSNSSSQPTSTTASSASIKLEDNSLILPNVKPLEDDSLILQNVKLGQDTDQKVFKFTKKKSRGGCITCKIRKKRCSEDQPICSDCTRLKKKCVWATDDMTNEQIRELKRAVEKEEEDTKLKRRIEFQEKRMNSGKRSKTILHNNHDPNNHDPNTNDNTLNDTTNHQPKPLFRIPSYNDLHNIHELHGENTQRNQTPIATNLIRMSHHGSPPPLIPPLSPSGWDSPQTESFLELSNFFESNIRGSFDRYSQKITELDDDLSGGSNYHSRTNISKGNDNSKNDDEDDKTSLDNENCANIRSPLVTFSQYHAPLSPNGLVQMNSTEQLFSFSPMFDFFSIAPSPSISMNLNLDPMASYLYDYYRNNLASIVSIVPHESNFYLKYFLPMAQSNPGVLNGILAWSAYHIGGKYEIEGAKYMDKALDFINQNKIKSDTDSLEKLASLLIMCAAEICKGDVKKWPILLQWGAKVIKERGGLPRFKRDKQQQWLISNFVYHDILASSNSERGTYFPVEEYENFVLNEGFGIDPLQGIVKPLFNIIGDISRLATECKRLLKLSSSSLGSGIMTEDYGGASSSADQVSPPGIDTPESESEKKVSRYSSLLTIMQKASQLESKINDVKPASEDLNDFDAEELEIQLTLFELFQLTAKLHLRQSVLRLNPSSLETQFILCELLKCLDIVLKSPVEGSLCFPMFIAGMNCTTKKDRKIMLERFHDLITRYSFKNLERAKTIMEQVWIIDPTGTKCVDWYEIVNNLRWDLSFA